MSIRAPLESLRDGSFERILLVKPSSLGDVIHALPVVHGLRTRYPHAQIGWLINSSFAPVLEGHPDLDEVIPFDRRRYGRFGRAVSPSLEFLEFIRRLRARKYELAIDLQGLFRSGFLTFATGAPVRLGFDSAREMAWMFYTHRVPISSDCVHAVDQNFVLADVLGFGNCPKIFNMALTDNDRSAAAKALRDAGLVERERYWTISPGARWETKKWAPQRFSELIDIVEGVGAPPAVLLGDGSERTLCEQICEQARCRTINIAGQTGVRTLAAVIEGAAAVLSHDSAPMHIATALNRPLVAIIGPTNPKRTGPYENLSSVIQTDLECAPCYLKRLALCEYDHRCMGEVAVRDVADAVVRALAIQPLDPVQV